jgi:P27 family predicted phage terminase small subunit
MAMPAKSALEHRLNGTKSHAKNQAGSFTGGRPKFPKNLSPAARKIFKRTVAILEARKTLTEGDELLLSLFATITERWLEATKGLTGNLMVKIPLLDSNGTVHFVDRVNPLLKIATESEARLVTIAKTLGLSPTDRERSKQTAIDDRDEIVAGSIEDIEQNANVLPFVPLVPTGDENAE